LAEDGAVGAFVALADVAERAPCMHAGQFATLEQVLDHYDKAPAAPQGQSELKPLGLTDRETAQIVRFLGTLSAPVKAEPRWLDAPRQRPLCRQVGALLDMQVFACILSPHARTRRMDADKVFKALGDPTRRRLLDLLCEKNGQTLGELCEHLDMARQSATQHIGLLEAANLVSTVWRGREKLHFINPVPLHEVYERWVRKFERQRLSLLHDLKKELEGE
jgi:DNA-binding transcriptional ArsR family regulator